MTNKEYIEKNNISFSEAMKMYDNEKYPCINDWLNQEHKFKVGDFVKLMNCNTEIGVVIDVKDKVYFKFLNRFGNFDTWDTPSCYDANYHQYEQDVFFMKDGSEYEKIF